MGQNEIILSLIGGSAVMALIGLVLKSLLEKQISLPDRVLKIETRLDPVEETLGKVSEKQDAIELKVVAVEQNVSWIRHHLETHTKEKD